MAVSTAAQAALRVLSTLGQWLALLGGLGLLGLVGLTVADVALRYLFAAPIFGAHDLAELGLLLIVYLVLPYCGRTGGHVALDLVVLRLAPLGQRIASVTVRIIVATVFGALAWRSVGAAETASYLGSASNLLFIPHAPFYFVIAGSALLYALMTLLEIVAEAGGRDPTSSDGASDNG